VRTQWARLRFEVNHTQYRHKALEVINEADRQAP